ncbi:MAG: hypothetical protein WCD44_04165, partial [Candidatus Babeliales bacterium]
ISGQLETIETPVPGRNEIVLVPFFSASASYINGGLTFIYPIGLFSSTPTVRIGIELGGIGYLLSRTISAQITANSASSTTIRVNLGTVGLITEAATGDVIVHLFANET